MKLRLDVSLPEFLRSVAACAGDVLYSTPEGDHLNLKSQLSKYIFLAAADKKDSAMLLSGRVVCSESADIDRLSSYLMK